MNPVREVWCRAYQAAFRAAIPVMPYREPFILESTDDIAALSEKAGKRASEAARYIAGEIMARCR